MKILVTGSNGFIGSHVCRALIERGHTVRAFHRAASKLQNLDDLPVEHYTGDLTQPETLQAAMQDVEVVFHTAAWMGGNDQPGRLHAVTVEGTRAVLQAAREAGVRRLVYTSSVAALGAPDGNSPGSAGQEPMLLNENHVWNLRQDDFPYGYAKYLAEQAVQQAVTQGLDAVIVNPGLVFGAGDVYRVTGSLIMQVAARRLSVAMQGGVNCVHIADVTDGHMAAMEQGRTGQRYILGGENLTHLELLQLIAGVTGVTAPNLVLPTALVRALAGPAQAFKTYLNLPVSPELLHLAGYYFFFDRQKAAAELGLTTPRAVEAAIAEAYAWLKAG